MRYQVTEQYRRGEERFIAKFSLYTDWAVFKAFRVREDEAQRRGILYRLYENSELIEIVNETQLCTASAQYAEGGRLIEISPALIYRVTLRVQGITHELACFDYYSDVKLFLMYRCVSDHHLDEHDVFCVFKHETLIETFPVHTVRASVSSENQTLTAHFNPIPTPTTFKPPGFPQNHWPQ